MAEQEYADEGDEHFVRTGFTEREMARKIYRFGNVAAVFSSYEGKETNTGKLLSRGVKISIFMASADGFRQYRGMEKTSTIRFPDCQS